ncbi:MAG: hypothetical protein RLZZ299_1473 [Pseudomonadota bacterium]|jgi:hypothetical protein
MRAGARVAGGWELTHELPGTDATWRWACRAPDGREAECVGLRSRALVWPGAREGFTATPAIDHPAALPVLARDQLEGVPVRVQPPTRGILDGLPPARVPGIAVWLGGAVLAGRGACRGALQPHDLVVDGSGVPRLAPLGIIPPASLAGVDPHAAPEGAADAIGDLYGLGVALFRAATGHPPWRARTPETLATSRAAGLPSTGDADADAVLTELVLTDPGHRAASGVVRANTHAVSPPAPLAPSPAPAERAALPAPTAPALPVPAGSGGFPRYVVLATPARLGHGALWRLAAQSGSDPDAIRTAAARNDAWAVDGFSVEMDARALARRLGAAGIPSDVHATQPPRVIQHAAIAVVAGVIGVLAGQALLGMALAAVFSWMAIVNLRGMVDTARVRMAWTARGRHPLPARLPEARARALQERIARAELSEVIAVDLRGRLDDLTHEIGHIRDDEGHAAEVGAHPDSLAARMAAVTARLDSVERDLAGTYGLV